MKNTPQASKMKKKSIILYIYIINKVKIIILKNYRNAGNNYVVHIEEVLQKQEQAFWTFLPSSYEFFYLMPTFIYLFYRKSHHRQFNVSGKL